MTIALGALILIVLLALPLLSLLPPDNAFHISAYTLTLVGKILCYAIVALALDLVWGYAGMLSSVTACSLPWAVMPWACT